MPKSIYNNIPCHIVNYFVEFYRNFNYAITIYYPYFIPFPNHCISHVKVMTITIVIKRTNLVKVFFMYFQIA